MALKSLDKIMEATYSTINVLKVLTLLFSQGIMSLLQPCLQYVSAAALSKRSLLSTAMVVENT